MDKLFSQQSAHYVGAEVDNVLDLPEGLLCTLKKKKCSVNQTSKKVNTLDPVLQSVSYMHKFIKPFLKLDSRILEFVPVYMQWKNLHS